MNPRNLLITLLLAVPLILNAQWQLQSTNFPDGMRDLACIWAVNEHIVWAMSDYAGPGDSTLQEYTRTLDGGQNWNSGSVPGMNGYVPTMIFALNADTAWVCFYHDSQDGGKILRTNDGGQNWMHQSSAAFPSAEEAYPNIVYFWDAMNGFAMGDPTYGFFELYTTSNGGSTWERVDSNLIPPIISGEYGYAGEFTVIGNEVWFGTSKGRIMHSADQGYTWSAINTPLLNAGKCRFVEFRDNMHGIVADRSSDQAEMYETNDGGQSWNPIMAGGTAYARYFDYIPGTDSTYISSSNAGSMQGVSISYDDGHNWMSVADPMFGSYGVLSFPNPLAGWAGIENYAGGAGGVLKYIGNTVGFNDPPDIPSIQIRPNPARHSVMVSVDHRPGPTVLSIITLSGKLVRSITISGAGPEYVDISKLPAGTYLLQGIDEPSLSPVRLLVLP